MTIVWIVVGLVIGWNLPQPQWAIDLQARIADLARGSVTK